MITRRWLIMLVRRSLFVAMLLPALPLGLMWWVVTGRDAAEVLKAMERLGDIELL